MHLFVQILEQQAISIVFKCKYIQPRITPLISENLHSAIYHHRYLCRNNSGITDVDIGYVCTGMDWLGHHRNNPIN